MTRTLATIVDLFEEQVLRTPDLVAVRDGRSALTYGDLNQIVNQWARLLRRRGVDRESTVGVLTDRSIGTVVACLAVSKAGGAYVPLAPDHPSERHRSVLRDCQPVLVLTESRHGRIAAALGPGIQRLEIDSEAAGRESPTNPPLVATAASLAYVLFTSGSTGRPKGVEIDHRALTNYLLWARREYGLAAGSVVPLFSPLGFDFTVTSLLVPLIAGGCVQVIEDYRTLFDADAGQNYQIVKFTPSHLGIVGGIADPRLLSGRSDVLVIGGEALLTKTLAGWRAAQRPPVMVNEYGPTEATVGCCTYRFDVHEIQGAVVPIGQPIANASIHLLDDDMRPVADGAVGEIYIGGVCLARGYRGQPGLTARRFVPDPFGAAPGGRLYRTGDLARRRPDGNLEFCGRIDDQVKILGYRVEPAEVEARLMSHPAIVEAAVLAQPDRDGEPRLMAFVVFQPGESTIGVGELRAHLQQSLPAYMVPLSFATLPSLPLTTNGKVDRRALADRRADDRTARIRPAAGQGPDAIARLWAEVLGVERVGLDDNFFEAGGESFAALRIVARLREETALDVPNLAVFEHPTPREFAGKLESWSSRRRSVPVERLGGRGPFPLSSAQRRLWFLAQMRPDSAEYNVPIPLRLRGPLRVPELRAAVAQLTGRHRVLRTVFPVSDGRAEQVVLGDWTCPLAIVELPPEAQPDAGRRYARMCSVEIGRPFDLAKDPPIRARLFRAAPDDHLLLLTVHHIATDVRSREIVLRDLGTFYTARCIDGAASGQGPATVEYTDYVAWQRRVASEPHFAHQLDYWRSRLHEPPIIDLAPGRVRRRPRSYRGSSANFALDAPLAARVRHLARRLGATTNVVTLSAFKLVLARLSGQQDIIVGSPAADRPAGEFDDVVGCFLNMLALRTDLSGGPSFSDLVRRVGATVFAALDNADVPFEQVIDSLGLVRDTSRPPLFQVSFSQHVDTAGSIVGFHELHAEQFHVAQETTRVDLGLSIVESDRIACVWEYSTELFEHDFIRQLHDYFEAVLRAAADTPDDGIDSIWARVVDGRAAALVGNWHPEPECRAHELFERQARRAPARTAVVCAGHALTYAELDDAADRLSRVLRGAGVMPEKPVALCVERGIEMLVSVLAIWKAGGAYVPLDPSHPPERLAQVVAASGAVAVVTQRALAARLLIRDVPIVFVDAEPDGPPAPALPSGEPGGPASLAYVIATSGSTGVPKSVAVGHRGVVNLLTSFAALLNLGPDDTLVAVTTLSFDIAILELMLPLVTGSRLVIAERSQAADPMALSELITRSSATVMQATPSTWRMLADLGGIPGGLRHKLCGGEALREGLARILTASGGQVWNLYGPTETTVWSSANVVASPPGPIGIGCPIANTGIYVLDERLNLVPAGVAGEIFIGGDGVARGYVGAPGLTAASFLPDPFTPMSGGRMYRTGDLGRVRPDGTVEFLGRLDDQVKIRGHRVELGEIEAVLTAAPDVGQAVVTADREAGGSGSLVAYVVPAGGGASPDVDRVRVHARRHLPEYMVPAALVVLPRLPLTPNGKVDRKALPERDPRQQVRSEYQPPRNRAEEILVGIVEELLDVEGVGVDDNFFELGGDSILAVRVVSRARNAGLWLTPAHVVDLATVAEIAEAAARRPPRLVARGPAVGAVPPAPGQSPWYDSDIGFQVLGVDLDGDIDDKLIRAALSKLLRHHDLLRAERRSGASRTELVIPADGPTSPHLLRVNGTSVHRDWSDRAAEMISSTGPVIQAVHIRTPERRHRLLLAVHASIADRWSCRILAEDLLACLDALRRGGPPALPDRGTSYHQWLERLEDYAKSAVLRADAGYWLERERAPQGGGRPPDEPSTASSADGPVTTAHLMLSEDITAGLMNGEAEGWYGSAPRELATAALVLALTDEAETEPVWVIVDDERRETPFPEIDIDRTIGRFAYSYPLLLHRGGADLATCVRTVREELRTVPRHGLTYAVARHLSPDGELRSRLAAVGTDAVVFTFVDEVEVADVRAISAVAGTGSDPRRPALQVRCQPVDGRLQIEVTSRRPGPGRDLARYVGDRLVVHLQRLVQQSRAGRGDGAPAPARFPLAALTHAQLRAVAAGRGVDDVFPLTPVQHGMLFHSLYSPGQGMYLNQVRFQLRGVLELDALRQALEIVARRHGALRFAVRWRGLSEPHQVMYEDVPVPLRVVGSGATEAEVGELIRADRLTDFEFDQAPLYRVTVARTDDVHHLVWTNHHIALDGWSNSLLFAECWDVYASLVDGRVPADRTAPPLYRDYVSWIRSQSDHAANGFWRSLLEGAPTATPRTRRREALAPGSSAPRWLDRRLPADVSRQIRRFCAERRVTLAALMCATWALVLGRLTARKDVLFGVVMSGRFVPVPGVDTMIGSLSSTLPIRVEIPRYADAIPFLRTVHSTLSEMRRYDYSSLLAVQRAADRPPMSALFDTVVGVHTFPPFTGGRFGDRDALMVRRSGRGFMRTDRACTVSVYPGEEVTLSFRTDPTQIDETTARSLADDMAAAIVNLVADAPIPG
jgi:amino acid adenylation domain-containing protein